jgi:hypothetical protein
VQTSSRHVHLDVLVVGYLHLAPLTVSVVVANIESGLVVGKTKLSPFNVFHSKKLSLVGYIFILGYLKIRLTH